MSDLKLLILVRLEIPELIKYSAASVVVLNLKVCLSLINNTG